MLFRAYYINTVHTVHIIIVIKDTLSLIQFEHMKASTQIHQAHIKTIYV